VQLRRYLSPATVGREADLLVLNDVSPVLARPVVAGERVSCTDAEQDHAFRRDTLLRAADLDPFLRRFASCSSDTTFLVARLADLRHHLDHLEGLEPRAAA
jgi:hypothetical protein